jgi:adenine-specific DNA-methyltransferase
MRYYGGKEKLLDFIEGEIQTLELSSNSKFCDLFSGTAVVGRHFKQLGFNVTANDYLVFAKCLATCRIGINQRPKFGKLGLDPIAHLNDLPGESGFFSLAYSPEGTEKRQYFSTENAQRINAIRTQIYYWYEQSLISEEENDYLIVALLEAMNRTSNVSGTYAAYLKSWDSRSLKPLFIEEPVITPGIGTHKVHNRDAVELANKISCDLVYLDPPYNSRQYSSNYFLLDIAARGWFHSEPEVRGVTGMRDNSSLKSDFCSKKMASQSLQQIIESVDARYVALSYNNEGIIPHDEIFEMMSAVGDLRISEFKHRRYRAINHDPKQLSTTEYLFILKKKD